MVHTSVKMKLYIFKRKYTRVKMIFYRRTPSTCPGCPEKFGPFFTEKMSPHFGSKMGSLFWPRNGGSFWPRNGGVILTPKGGPIFGPKMGGLKKCQNEVQHYRGTVGTKNSIFSLKSRSSIPRKIKTLRKNFPKRVPHFSPGVKIEQILGGQTPSFFGGSKWSHFWGSKMTWFLTIQNGAHFLGGSNTPNFKPVKPMPIFF